MSEGIHDRETFLGLRYSSRSGVPEIFNYDRSFPMAVEALQEDVITADLRGSLQQRSDLSIRFDFAGHKATLVDRLCSHSAKTTQNLPLFISPYSQPRVHNAIVPPV